MSFIRPPFLKKGDKISIVAPAGPLKNGALKNVLGDLENAGFEVEIGSNVWNTAGYFAAKDGQRLEDLQSAIDDLDSRAVLCARGGYGSTRIIDQLDISTLEQNPKWLIGYSDITAVHLKLNTAGIESVHGPMGTSFARNGAQVSTSAMLELLQGKVPEIDAPYSSLNRIGTASGPIIGGNLALLVDSLGTKDELVSDNRILFLEDIGEPVYKIDRMLTQLHRSGKLEKLKGLAIGDFSEVDSEKWKQVIMERVAGFGFPVAFTFPIGHEPHNMPVVIGAQYQLTVSESGSLLSVL